MRRFHMKIVAFFMLGLLSALMSAEGRPRDGVAALKHDGRHGRVSMSAGGKRFPGGAKVSFGRTRSEAVERRVCGALAKMGAGNGASRVPRVLAMYDVSVSADGRKWQPEAGEPVRVEVELSEPVPVGSGSSLSVVHLADDGEIEELPPSRFGFVRSDDGATVVAFWFSASGFSIYSIVDMNGDLATPRRFYHFYDHPSAIEGSHAVRTFPYRYADRSNDVVNVQIVKDGDMLKEPPVPEDILDENGVPVSTFEGWYVVHNEPRPANAVESKLDSAVEPFTFVWPVGVTERHLAFTNGVSVTENADTDYYVVPLYEHARYLQFNEKERDEQGTGDRIIDRKIIALNDETGIARIKVSDVSAALKNSRQEYFCGWSYLDKNGQYTDLMLYSNAGTPQEEYINIDDALFQVNGGNAIQLWPLYVSAHFLNFDTNAKGSGATYVGSLFVRSTTDIGAVAPSGNRLGYDFAGWCTGTVEGGKVRLGERVTDANGRVIPNVTATNTTGEVILYTDASGNIRLNKDVTLYASWTANTSASYRVIVWQQRVTDSKNAADADKKYFYVTHYTSPEVSASTAIADSLFKNFTGTRADGTSFGSAVNLATLSGPAAANAANEDFTGFHYARWACEDATVASDGTTVINVYYDRDLITLRFSLYDSNQTETTYSTTTSTSGDIYGTDDGESYFAVYYDDGQWYKTRTSWQGYEYSTQFTGTRYVRSGTNWLGQPSYSQTTSNEGEQYRRTGSVLNYTYHIIYYNEADGKWYENYSEVTNYAYSDPYGGYRYTASTSNWIVNQTMTGLYGQTLAANGYVWPSGRRWYDGNSGSSTSGTQISFLDAFLPTSGGDETYYSTATTSTSSSNTKVYFYKENLDGSWLRVNEFDAGSSSVNFNISDKYNGFQAYQYSTDGESTWKSVGAYNESTHYYGSQVSGSKLSIRFKRREFELIYKDGDATVYGTGKNIPYESPLAGHNLGLNDSKLDWGSRDTSVGTFEGWYEDASLTVPFDFTATMPDGKKFLYAKWAPVKYKVIIDPNGGELQSGDSTWFYLDAGEKVVEYTVTRKYRLDMHNGTFYYHHDLWDPVKDKHTDQYDPSTAGAPRAAYYTENVEEATSNEVSNPENRFSYEPGAYSFMGWYEVFDDGTVSLDPFNFSEPPNRPVAIRAIWRRTSVYTLTFESIDPDGVRDTEWIYDPEQGAEGGYIDDGITMVGKDPTNYDREKWIWEGWHVVDVRNNYNPLTNIRSPGDIYVVHAEHADDRDNVIHFRAVYSLIESGVSRHIPEVVDFVLDSNEGGMLAAGQTVQPQDGRLGTYTEGAESSLGGLNAGVWFAGQQNNFSVNLADYSPAFAHANGYFLLGWDTNRVNGTMIPAFYANETVGIDKADADGNVLYAVWEPQVYVDFVNDTGDDLSDITLYVPSWTEDGLFRVNEVSGVYRREPFTDFAEGAATFGLAAGETLRLVLPDAADRDFAVFGNSPYAEGTKLAITRTEPQIAGAAAIPDETFSAYAGERYQVAGIMKTSPTPVQVRFTKSTYPASTSVSVRYFLHDPDGTVTEITNDSGSWESYGSVKKTLAGIGGDSNDIAALLRKSATEGVHEYLVPSIKEQYGYTTIGIGAATGDFDEWRSITKGEPFGGSYLKFYHEQLEWSRYSQVWSPYDDAAVYVVFYKRIPVHITVGKTVEGTEEDKDREFSFSTEFTEHLEVFEYTVETRYTATRTATYTRNNTSSAWPTTPTSGATWTWDDGTSTPGPRTSVAPNPEETAFDARSADAFTLRDGGRHPETIYFSSSDEGDEASARTIFGSLVPGNTTYYRNTTGNTSGNASNARRKVVEETTNYTQTVTHRVVYRYETAVVRETSASDLYMLTDIGDDPHHNSDQCSGVKNIGSRSYTISSKMDTGTTGVYTYTPLDTAIFTNTRKTGSLTVSKTVVDGDAGDTFNFIVTLGETVVDKDHYTVPPGVHLGPFGKVFTFSLANGGSQTLTGLPAGASYTVEEVANGKYIATVPANAAGAIAADAAISVGFTNTRKTDLAIAMKDRSVYFNGEEQHGCEIASVAGTGEEVDANDYTVTGLKAGHVLSVEHHVAAHGTTVGAYVGHFENARITIRDSQDNDVSHEYIVTTTPGSLTIEPTPIVVTITGNHATMTYNGAEQSCEGYTFAITHATTHEPVESGSIYVSIPPEYQQAFRKDVGRSDMYIQPGRVSVTVPDGVSVANIEVAANGYVEIVPAAATVTADDKAKIAGRPDPAFTATVSGLCGTDTPGMIAYSLGRDAGEAVGTYAIRATGASEQGNYTVTYVQGTLSVQELSLIQRSTGSGVSVSTPISDEMIAALGFDGNAELSAASVGEAMNRVDANGLRRWENLVTGTATNRLLLGTAADASGSGVTFSLSDDPASPEDLGYTVLHELRKFSPGGWIRLSGPTAAAVPSFSVDEDDATGYYRIVTLVVPDANLAITNEIPTTNTVGVLRIASTATHTMTAVPFVELPNDPALKEPVKVAGYIGGGFVRDGDVIRIREGGTFKVWAMEGGTFTPYSSVKTDGETVDVDDADRSALEPGRAVWVSRSDHGKPFTLVGQFCGDAVTAEIAGSGVDGDGKAVVGCTMVSNPGLEALKINDIDWGGNPYEGTGGIGGDSIEIPSSADGVPSTRLFWSADKRLWGMSVPKKVGKRFVQTFESDFEIPAGMGFWYYRAGGPAFSVTVKNPEELD